MDGSGSMQSNEERGAEKLMDDYLRAIGLHRKKIAKDGSCLFRAVAEQVLHCQSLHTKVRAKCVEFLKENRESYEAFIEGDFEDYLFKLQDPQQWVGEVEINALAVMYKRDFLIFQEPGKQAVNITDNNFKDKVQLCFLNGNHYDSVYPISRIKGAALCQSILYELLYDGVFKEDRSALTLCQRAGRPSDLLSDDSMNACVSSDDDDAGEPDEALWVENGTTARPNNQGGRGRGRGRHLPERVRRSLNPTLFRNIEFDVWHKSKRAQQKMDYCIAAGMQYAVGDRCQVRIEGSGRSYNATIRELSANNGPVTVYLEETGTRKQVPLWSLRPPTSDEKSWSTVVRDKRLSNGHGEWEERTKGRGRGKPAPASSPSVALATGPAFSGRVQKQHSWPQSSPVEEPGGAKASRKSCLADIGLTDTQRSAKKVEEMNVALVEIQLRDEHSFPALGAQAGMTSDGGRKKGGDKRRSQRNKTKSPVEDVGAPSPSGGERPKSSTPPLASAAPAAPAAAPPAAAAPPLAPAATPNPTNASLPAAPSANSFSSDPAKTKTAAPPPSPPASAPPARPPATGGAAAAPPPSATLFLTPALPATPPSSSSSLPTKSSASPPPSSSLPPPTFIAPIAPSPTAAQGFLPPSSLPRCSPPPSSLPHSPSPPSFPSSSPLVHEAPPLSAQSSSNLGGTQTIQAPLYQTPPQPQIQSQISVPQTQTQVSLTHGENQTQTPQVPMPHVHTEAQPFLPQPQSHTEAASLPQSRIQPPLPQTQYLSRSQSEVVPPSHPAPGAYYHPPQASGLASVHPQPSAPHPHLHVQPAHPPHPSQVPHPSLALSASQTSNTQSLSQGLLPQPHPESPVHAPPQPSHPPHPSLHPSHHPQLQSAPPPHHQSIQPLQQLSQLYLDPLYPGFPQGETGDPAPIPPYSSSKSGDDLPPDLNMLRFFFNLGVKAYSMPMFPPYIYLYPLQQAHTMHPKLPSRSPSPTPHYPPSRHQEAYPHPQYPPASAPMPPQYDHQAPPAEPPHPSEPTFNQAEYPPPQPQPHRMPCPSLPWQHHQMPAPRNPSYAVGYPNQSPSYRATPPLSQGFHPGQGPGQLLYSQYPPSSMGYQSSSAPPDDLQVSHGLMEQHQPANGDSMPCQGPSRLPALLESPASANVANANNNRTVVVPGFALKKDPGDGLTRAVLLVDPPLNNRPIITLVPNPDIKDVSMATMNPRSSPGSPLPYDIISKTTVLADNKSSRGYRGNRKPIHPANTYVPLGGAEPGHMGFLPTGAMGEALSVGCSTEDDWEEAAGFKPATMNHRGPRRNPRGGRGRGGHDPGRGAHRRRHGGEPGELNYVQFSSSHRGRGRERGYM